jgi:uncharacterized membrane protein YedE/YeeE
MYKIIEWLSQPWPWYVAGPMIGLTVPVLLLLGNKSFGISSSLKHICAACIPAKIPFFHYDWKSEMWNLVFVFGVFLGGIIGEHFFTNPNLIEISPATVSDLTALGITHFSDLMPLDIFSWSNLFTQNGFLFIVLGGFLVGFGTRYADGCTSGHAIMGLSNLQWPSLVATVSFMIGGIVTTHFILPLLF